MPKVFLSLGSNIQDRLSNIQQAVSALSLTNGIEILKSSSFYETEPWGVKNQNWFLNAIVAIETNYTPSELLKIIQKIELQLGRNRINEVKWSQRIIDIDILFYDDLIINLPDLIIPHPYLHERAFVLVPMLEVKADFVHPVFNKTITDLYNDLVNPEDVFLYGTILPK